MERKRDDEREGNMAAVAEDYAEYVRQAKVEALARQRLMRYPYCQKLRGEERRGFTPHELDRLRELHRVICGHRGVTPMWHETRVELINLRLPGELFRWVQRWFFHLAEWEALTVWMIEMYREEFARHNILANEPTAEGEQYLLLDRGEASAHDYAKVAVCGTGRVVAWDHTEVLAFGQGHVDARGHSIVTALRGSCITIRNDATVTATDQAFVTAWHDARVTLTGGAVARLCGDSPGPSRLLVPEGMTVERYRP